MAIAFNNIVDAFWGAFDKRSFWIDHPCISTDNHAIIIGREYWLKTTALPMEKIIVKRVLLNITNVKIKVLSIQHNKSYWISQAFDELYWNIYDWKLLDNSKLTN